MKFLLGILESIPPEFTEELNSIVRTVDLVGAGTEQIIEKRNQLDGVLVKSTIKIDRKFLQSYRKVKVAIRAGTGLDNIVLRDLERAGVTLISTPGANAVSTAEFALLQILLLARKIPQAFRAMEANDFNRDRLMGVEIASQTVGIIGLGNVGIELARRLQLLGCQVICNDNDSSKKENADRLGLAFSEQLEPLLEASDIISLNATLGKTSTHLLGRDAFNVMKRGVLLVNSARAGLVEDAALLRALDEGIVAAAAVDVLDPEPPFYMPTLMTQYTHALLNHPKVFVTPHIGASTRQAQLRIGAEIVRSLKRHIESSAIEL